MFRRITTALFALSLLGTPAVAQTSASQVVTGQYSTSGTNCTVGPCFLPNTPPSTESGALTANQVIKNSPGNLYSFEVAADSTLSSAAWWIMIYDATSAPVDGAVTPTKCYAMPSGTTSFTAAFPNPIALTRGIVIGASTTGCFTKTESAHAFISGDAQ